MVMSSPRFAKKKRGNSIKGRGFFFSSSEVKMLHWNEVRRESRNL